jgi:hypothetical protein
MWFDFLRNGMQLWEWLVVSFEMMYATCQQSEKSTAGCSCQVVLILVRKAARIAALSI